MHMHMSTGRYTSAEIADLAPFDNVHVFRGGKRQFLELDDETKFKMSERTQCPHLSAFLKKCSDQN